MLLHRSGDGAELWPGLWLAKQGLPACVFMVNALLGNNNRERKPCGAFLGWYWVDFFCARFLLSSVKLQDSSVALRQ